MWLACWTLCSASSVVQAASSVTLYYYERKPFHYTTDDGHAVGLMVTPTTQIFEKAGVTISWKVMPVSRILATIKANVGDDCSPGWYKTPEREDYARYSLPIYSDKPLVGLARADFPARQGITAKELFLQAHARLLIKQGFVHGTYFDQIIAAMPPANVIRVPEDVSSMVKMVRYGIADVVPATPEEAEVYVANSGYGMKEFRILNFSDIPAVEKRYIICSKRVPAELMDKLNAIIKTMPPASTHIP